MSDHSKEHFNHFDNNRQLDFEDDNEMEVEIKSTNDEYVNIEVRSPPQIEAFQFQPQNEVIKVREECETLKAEFIKREKELLDQISELEKNKKDSKNEVQKQKIDIKTLRQQLDDTNKKVEKLMEENTLQAEKIKTYQNLQIANNKRIQDKSDKFPCTSPVPPKIKPPEYSHKNLDVCSM